MNRIRIPLLLCVTLAGCMPDSPRTAFDWGVNDKLPRPVAAKLSSTVGSEAWNSRDLKSRPH